MDNIKYRIFCITENDWREAWASEPLSSCPVNASHDVNIDSVQEIATEKNVFISIVPASTNNSSYTKLFSLYYNTQISGQFRRLQLVCRCDGDTSSFNIKAFDYTNQLVLLESTQNNTEENMVVNIGSTDSAPSTDFFLEIYAKTNNGSGNVHIEQIIVSSIE